jgi:diguanylate cyclase (GGDEF)-like protein/PAS domain S-box-containing protein
LQVLSPVGEKEAIKGPELCVRVENSEKGKTRGKVVIVDDDHDVLVLMRAVLEDAGYKVFEACSGKECFAVVAREKPEVALVDFMLPGMNGLEIIGLLKRMDENLAAIAVTGQGSEKLAVEIMQAGAQNYLGKPFENNELLALVEHAFAARQVEESIPYRDLSSANKALVRNINEREAILESMVDGLFTTDPNLRILSWNSASEKITGVSSAGALGRRMGSIFGEQFCRAEHGMLRASGDNPSSTSLEAAFDIEGHRKTVIKTSSLLRGGKEEILGLVVCLKDITQRKILLDEWIETELELDRTRSELDEKERLAKKHEALHSQVEDMTRRVSEISTLHEVSRLLTSKLSLDDVLDTVMNLAGDLFRAQAYSIRLLDENETVLRVAAHYGLSEEYLRRGPIEMGKSIAGAVAKNRRPIYVPDALDYGGLHKVEVARQEGLKSILCFPLMIREDCIGVMTFYHKKTHRYSDDEMHFLAAFAGSVSIAVDNARLYEKQTRLAISDGLTGLCNHRFFHESLNEEVVRAGRYERNVSVIILDIDHFKKYNDAHGHQAGDRLLKELSAVLTNVARLNDVVGRYGGEEFVYLLHEANKGEAMLFAKRLLQRVADHVFEGESVLPGGKLTVSLGVASFPEDASSSQDLIHHADMALYLAKSEGRNQVRAFQVAG